MKPLCKWVFLDNLPSLYPFLNVFHIIFRSFRVYAELILCPYPKINYIITFNGYISRFLFLIPISCLYL